MVDARYFDGNTSRHEDVFLSLHEHQLIIQNDSFRIVWPLSTLIRKSDIATTTGQHLFTRIDDPLAYFEIKDDSFATHLADEIIRQGTTKKQIFLEAKSVGIPLLIFAVILILLPRLSYFAAGFLPQSWEIALGDSVYERQFKAHKVVLSEPVNDAIKTWIQVIDPNTQTAPPISVVIVSSNVENAFALPNGKIVVDKTIIQSLISLEEFTAILSHEMAHIRRRHSAKMLLQHLLSDAKSVLNLGAAGNLLMDWILLGSVRKIEHDADTAGITYLRKAGLRHNGYVTYFGRKASEDKMAWLQYFSTHPSHQDRHNNAKQIQQLSSPKKVPENKSWTLLKKELSH